MTNTAEAQKSKSESMNEKFRIFTIWMFCSQAFLYFIAIPISVAYHKSYSEDNSTLYYILGLSFALSIVCFVVTTLKLRKDKIEENSIEDL